MVKVTLGSFGCCVILCPIVQDDKGTFVFVIPIYIVIDACGFLYVNLS